MRIFLQSLRALCKAPLGAGSIWKYLEALARATGVLGRFAYGFRTKLHFADVVAPFHVLQPLAVFLTVGLARFCMFYPMLKQQSR